MAIEVGSKAPDFTLINQKLEPVTLSEELEKNNALLAFFPAAFSSVCTHEMCTLRDSLSRLQSAGTQIYGISTDTFFALQAFANQQGITFPLLSDFNKDVIRLYGVVNPDMIGLKEIAKRAVFVIDRQGIVRAKWVLDDAREEPDYEAIRAAVANLS
jgi:peroxiredoxin